MWDRYPMSLFGLKRTLSLFPYSARTMPVILSENGFFWALKTKTITWCYDNVLSSGFSWQRSLSKLWKCQYNESIYQENTCYKL